MEVVVIHGDNIVDGIGVDACSNMIALGWQGQVAASYPPPHVDGKMVAHLVTERICSGGVNYGQARKGKVLVHAGHIGQCRPFRQKLEQGIQGGGLAHARLWVSWASYSQ